MMQAAGVSASGPQLCLFGRADVTPAYCKVTVNRIESSYFGEWSARQTLSGVSGKS
jgi:hypothetical protein